MQPVRYHDLVFQPDMLVARRDDGTAVRFTRQERALLLRLTRQPNALVTRDQLLAGLGDEAGRFGERNVDYLVNRLRRRLGDSARAPRFVATQYGEGYAWIAEPVAEAPVSAFLVVGPVFGLAAGEGAALPLLERLAAALRAALGGKRAVLCRPGWRPDPQGGDDVAYGLDASTHEEGGQVHLALVLREGRTRKAIRAFRLALARGNGQEEIESLAQALIDAIWADSALPDGDGSLPAERPMHLRMHDAAVMLTGDLTSWRENEPRLRAAYAASPGDPKLSVLLALNQYARLVLSVWEIRTAPIDEEAWQAIEDEIETLALAALPHAGGDPLLLLGIAKLVFFIDRGHLALAEKLTEQAFLASTAFAAAFSMKGQIEASKGRIDAALALHDKAIELAEPGSQFHIYLMVLKATALLAGNRRGELDALTAELYERDPRSRFGLGLFFLSPRTRTLPPHFDQMLKAAGPETARHLLTHFHQCSARHFLSKAHQRNVMRGFMTHLVRSLGPGAVPASLQARFPEMVRQRGQATPDP